MPYFTFKVDDEILFRTKVSSIQCKDITKKGTRCKRRCVIGSAFCSSHLAYNHHLKIKKSTIPDAGKGLFASDPLSSDPNEIVFKKGATIVQYEGETINLEKLENRYGDKTAPYSVMISKNKYIDASKIRSVGSLANTNPPHNNATLSVSTGRGTASLKATKNIKNGEEIFLSYGRSYKLDEPGVESSTITK
jgi:hypothetical protein